MDLTFEKSDIEIIMSNVKKTGYNPEDDEDYASQNWHAGDDSAISIVPFNALSKSTRRKMAKAVGNEVPDGAVVDFRWNIEWGNWSNLLSPDGKCLLNFYAEGLPLVA